MRREVTTCIGDCRGTEEGYCALRTLRTTCLTPCERTFCSSFGNKLSAITVPPERVNK